MRFAILAATFFAQAVMAAGELIVIDPGHTLEHPGVVGSCETQEVWVNDQLSLKLAALLQQSGYRVEFTRTPNTDRSRVQKRPGREPAESLYRRGDRANRLKAALFISLHHDAIAEDKLIVDASACPGMNVKEPKVIHPAFLRKHQVGFNVFIHNDPGTKFQNSLKFASLIGKGFIASGQVPANFHVPEVEPDCTSCRWRDRANGVMSRNLAVIRRPAMPAILLEVTNLRVAELERLANDENYQMTVAQIVNKAVNQYFGREN